MFRPSRTLRRRWGRPAAAMLALAVAVAVPTLGRPDIASAFTTPVGDSTVIGNATYFDGLGSPYGGCGIPQSFLDNPNYVALNVYNTPKDYTMYNRPMPAGDAKIGMWNNGHNCDRYVQVTIDDYCDGTNDGAVNQTFCRGEGKGWISDKYNGATLTMIVGDSCGDSNAWCRDDPYHLDLAHSALNTFVKDGAKVGDMDPLHWNNRHIKWSFIPTPNYTGDIQLAFLRSSGPWWTALAANHLPKGIHGMEYWDGAKWVDAPTDGDMGQAFLIHPTTQGGMNFKVRVRDLDDKYVFNGREYSLTLPSSCSNQCQDDYLVTPYTTSGGEVPTTIEPPTNLKVLKVTSNSVQIGWTPSTTTTVTGYDVYKWSTRITGTKTATSVTITGLDANRDYKFNVMAHDAAGKQSVAASVSTHTAKASGDTTAPSAPTGLKVLSTTSSSVRLGWTAATDNVSVTGYDVYRNGVRVTGTSSSTTVTVSGYFSGTFTVKAHDAAGNLSAASAAVTV